MLSRVKFPTDVRSSLPVHSEICSPKGKPIVTINFLRADQMSGTGHAGKGTFRLWLSKVLSQSDKFFSKNVSLAGKSANF